MTVSPIELNFLLFIKKKITKILACTFGNSKKNLFFHLLSCQALKDSKEVEVIDLKIRRKDDPLKWPLPGLTMPNQTHTDFSQLINCPEFIPRQMTEEPKGKCLLTLFICGDI